MQAFSILKDRLVSAPIVVAPYWDLPIELMCDAKSPTTMRSEQCWGRKEKGYSRLFTMLVVL